MPYPEIKIDNPGIADWQSVWGVFETYDKPQYQHFWWQIWDDSVSESHRLTPYILHAKGYYLMSKHNTDKRTANVNPAPATPIIETAQPATPAQPASFVPPEMAQMLAALQAQLDKLAAENAELRAAKPQGLQGQVYTTFLRTDNGELQINLPATICVGKNGGVDIKVKNGQRNVRVDLQGPVKVAFAAFVEAALGGKLADKVSELRTNAPHWTPTPKEKAEAASAVKTFSLTDL